MKFNPSYISPRPDIEKLVMVTSRFILDVGCSTGIVGESLKLKTGAQIFGIELSEEMALQAAERIDRVFIGDALQILTDGSLSDYQFDCIIFADILEHLSDPWSALKAAKNLLTENGLIIASVPNVRHIDTIYNLVFKGFWPYRERGIHDKTHLRFFTKKNIFELFETSGLKIENVDVNYRLIERPHDWNRFAKYFAVHGFKEFLAFQYVVCAKLDISKSLD